MNPWADTSKPWPIRPIGLKDIQVSWLQAKKLEEYRKALTGQKFLELFWKAAYQLRAEGVISWKTKEDLCLRLLFRSSSIIECHLALYSLGAGADVSAIADGFLASQNETTHV